MEEQKKPNFLKQLEQDMAKYLLFGFLGLIGTGVIFYFDTKAINSKQNDDIFEVKTEVRSIKSIIQETSADPKITKVELDNIKRTLEDMKEEQRQIKQSQDKTLDIILRMSNRQ